MIRGVLLICILLLTACNSTQDPPKDDEEGISVYVDANSYLQIYFLNKDKRFPFETGDQVEIEGTLIYHGINDRVIADMLPDAKWHGSLYPAGTMLAPLDESLIVLLKDVGGQKTPYEIEWPIDTDTRFVIISDQPFPKRWSETIDIGSSTQVCFRLEIEVERNVENGNYSLITFMPMGEIVDKLMLTELYNCR